MGCDNGTEKWRRFEDELPEEYIGLLAALNKALLRKHVKRYPASRFVGEYCEHHYALLHELGRYRKYLVSDYQIFDPAEFVEFLKKYKAD